MRSSSRSAISSTRPCSVSKAACRPLAWATRSSRPAAPSTTCWAARSRRSLTARTSTEISASSATAPAASAAMPAGSVRSFTTPKVYERRSAAREERRVIRLVVVGLLLARHLGDGRPDRHGRADRRRAVERELDGRALLRRELGHGLGQRDRVPAFAREPHRHLDVELVVLALVGELDDERLVWLVREVVGRAGLQRGVAIRRRVDPSAVQARAGRLAVAAAAAAELLVEHGGDRLRLQPGEVGHELRAADALAGDAALVERVLDERHHARLPRDVGGEEDLHLAGDALDRRVGGLALV